MASSLPVICILLSAEDSREGIATGQGRNLSLVSAHLIILLSGLFLFSPFFSHEVVITGNDLKRWEGRTGSPHMADWVTRHAPLTYLLLSVFLLLFIPPK